MLGQAAQAETNSAGSRLPSDTRTLGHLGWAGWAGTSTNWEAGGLRLRAVEAHSVQTDAALEQRESVRVKLLRELCIDNMGLSTGTKKSGACDSGHTYMLHTRTRGAAQHHQLSDQPNGSYENEHSTRPEGARKHVAHRANQQHSSRMMSATFRAMSLVEVDTSKLL